MPCRFTRPASRVRTPGVIGLALTMTILFGPRARAAILQEPPRRPTQAVPPAAERVTPSPAAPTADYRVGPEDVLKITVLEAPDLSQTAEVSAAGEISLLLGGTLKVDGLTTQQIERAVRERLQEKYIRNPNVSVLVTEARSHTVSVMGAVKKPGVFEVRGTKSVLEVLSLAEGLAEDAGDTVLIVHADAAQPVTELRLSALMEAKDSALNAPIRPGDVVKVSHQGVIYVVGDVKKPGAYAIKGRQQTALNALALSEGLAPTSAPKNAMILRTNKQGDRDVVRVDLDKLMKGKSPDVTMAPEDVLFVPQSGAKSFGRAVKDFALVGLRIAFVW